jgi:urea carboxylase-associated protein 1
MAQGNTIPGTIIRDDHVAAGQPWDGVIRRGQVLRVIDLEGHQGVDFLCYNAENPEERYHAPNTLKKCRTLRLTRGHTLYSDIARPMFTIVDDSYGGHDTIAGCCSGPSNQMLYGVAGTTGCRENFLAALGRHGLGRRDIVPNVNFFCTVPVDDRRLADTVFVAGPAQAGDYIDLRAEMDALAVISNCPQVNNPCNDGKPKPIRVVIWQP